MKFLPIVARELRVASRRHGTYWVRTGAATAVMVLGTFVFVMWYRSSPEDTALALFGIMTGGAVLYALLSGVFSTADCLSEEKREGTLGLLFLTDLKGYDVVLGKLAASSLYAFYGVLAVVPISAIPLLLGGVTPGEFGRMALLAANTLFFSLTIGLGVSSMSRSARRAIAMTFVVLLFFAALLPLCEGLIEEFGTRTSLSIPCLLWPSPGTSFAYAFDVKYKKSASEFWISMAVIHGLGWFFLAAACVAAPRTWKDKPAGAQIRRWREALHAWSYGNPTERAVFRRRLLNKNPFFWLAARARLKPAYAWGILGLIAGGWLWGLAKYPRDWLDGPMFVVTGFVLNLLMKGLVAGESGRQLAEDRKLGSLELLLSTPLTVQDIMRGQMLALKRQFLGPLIVVLLCFLVFMFAMLPQTSSADERAFCVCFWLAVIVMLVADCVALAWIGLWQALTARNPNRITGRNLGRVVVLPWIGMAFVALLAALRAMFRGREPSWSELLLAWVVLGLAADIGFGGWARYCLATKFRLAAEQRYARPAGFWKRLFGAGSEREGGTNQPAISNQ
jgi:ABC-type transport system involved in cytochrome c biogenesis permease component